MLGELYSLNRTTRVSREQAATKIANTSSSYENNSFRTRIAPNFRDKHLDTIGADNDKDEYLDDQLELMIKAVYTINPYN